MISANSNYVKFNKIQTEQIYIQNYLKENHLRYATKNKLFFPKKGGKHFI
jgi:hypothetical protein